MKLINYRFLAILILLITSKTFVNAQGQGNSWYFGTGAGYSFTNNQPITNSQINTGEGCASISDAAGNPLFYTDGRTIWHANGTVMRDIDGNQVTYLHGDASTTQSAIIVPKPGSTTIYGIFTVGEISTSFGIEYLEVDLSMSGHEARISTSQPPASLYTPTCEKITAVRHSNCTDYWIITHEWNNTFYRTYLLTANGVDNTPFVAGTNNDGYHRQGIGRTHVQTTVDNVTKDHNKAGCIKASPNGRLLANAVRESGIDLFDFDAATATLSNYRDIITTVPSASVGEKGYYGVEFSTSNGILYYTQILENGFSGGNSSIHWYDIAAGTLSPNVFRNNVTGTPTTTAQKKLMGALQLGPDGNIYVAQIAQNYIGRISNANTATPVYTEEGIRLAPGDLCQGGLPTLFPGFFSTTINTSGACSNQVSFSATTTLPPSLTYQWNFHDGTSSTLANPVKNYPVSGNYPVTLTLSSSQTGICNNPATIVSVIAVDPLTNPKIDGASSLCNGTSTTLVASGAGTTGTYTWGHGPSGSIISVNSTGTYTVTMTNTAGCSAVVSKVITPGTTPTATITANGPTTFCQGGNVTLTASGAGTNGTYTWTNGPSTATYTVSASGTYIVTVKNSSGCTATVSQVVTVNPSPTPTITANGPTTFCQGENVTLTASGGGTNGTYTWTNGPSTATYTVSGSGTYIVTVKNSNGCTATKSQVVTVNPKPTPTITANGPTTFCQNGNVTLTASGGGTNGTYTWTNGPSTATYTVNASGTYIVTVKNSSGCTATKSQVVIVNPAPTATITANGPTTFCQGGNVTLTASGGGTNGTYTWTNGPSTATYTVSASGTYIVTVKNSNGCTATASQVVTVNPKPTATITANGTTTFCQGGNVTLTASGAGANGTYEWTNGPSTATYTVNASGTYIVTVKNSSGCTATARQVVKVNPAPIADAGPDKQTCKNSPVQIGTPGVVGNTYTWTSVPASTFITPIGQPTVSPSVNTTYTLKVTNPLTGCSATDVVVVTVQECCAAQQDPVFTKITTNPYIISANTTWDGKYYVARGVEVRVNPGVIFDVTNVDIVFDECASINVLSSGTFITNNSVFRPCDELKSWKGVTFNTLSYGRVNASTFINAVNGISISNSNVRVTENNFINNQVGIVMSGGTLSLPISNNNFVVDNSNVTYSNSNCSSFAAATAHTGISISTRTLSDVISQNSFVNSTRNNVKEFNGITILDCTGNAGSISSNKFTDMHRSLDIAGNLSARIKFENNICELTHNYSSTSVSAHQVRVSDANFISILNNTFKNANQNESAKVAIYGGEIRNSLISGNTVTGYETAIQLQAAVRTNVYNNFLKEQYNYGIYATDGNNLDISCNEIRMRSSNSTVSSRVGISYIQSTTALPRSISIRSNCIFDTKNAISLKLTSTLASTVANMPKVKNNYLYNYSLFGVYNENFKNSIGTGLTQATAGKNTFVSNNTPAGSIDVASTPNAITAYGNYGISSVSNVTISGNNMFNSIASCGQQIGTVSSAIGPDEICNNDANLPNQLISVTQDPALVPDFMKTLSESDPADVLDIVAASMQALINTNDLEVLYQSVNGSTLLTDKEKLWLNYYHSLYTDQYQSAEYFVGLAEKSNLKSVEEVRLALLRSGRTITELSATERFVLTAMANDNDKAAQVGRDMLNLSTGQHDYNFKPTEAASYKSLRARSILIGESALSVYPNPAYNTITVDYKLSSNTGASYLEISDPSGRVITSREIHSEFESSSFDLSSLSSGIYFVSLQSGGKLLGVSKFIKR